MDKLEDLIEALSKIKEAQGNLDIKVSAESEFPLYSVEDVIIIGNTLIIKVV